MLRGRPSPRRAELGVEIETGKRPSVMRRRFSPAQCRLDPRRNTPDARSSISILRLAVDAFGGMINLSASVGLCWAFFGQDGTRA